MATLVLFSTLFYSLVLKPAPKVKAATVGSSTSSFPNSSDSTQKTTVITSTGVIVAFYNAGSQAPTGIVYSTSSDGGTTWSAATQVTSDQTGDFSVAVDKNDNIYIAFVDTTASIISKKLTYSAGTWSIGSNVSVYTSTICTSQSEGDSMYKPILRVTPTGLALAFFQQYEISCQNSGTDFLNFATADFNLNWGVSNAGSFDVDAIGVSNIISNLVVDGNIIWFYLGTDLYYTTDGTSYNKVP